MHIPFSTLLWTHLAYLDPVSGGAILQTILGILLGITLVVRLFWRKISAFFARLTGKGASQETPPSPDQEPPQK